MTSEATTNLSKFIGLGIVVVAVLVTAVILLNAKSNNTVSPSPKSEMEKQWQGFDSQFWYLPDDDMLGFVEVPEGEFLMGSDPAIDRNAYENERWSDRLRRGRVELNQYYISRFEVTVAQFNAFVIANNYSIDERALVNPGDFPVTYVTLMDALAYCRWLDAQMRAGERIPKMLSDKLTQGWHITLPNEAQWEKAARGPEGRIYPWGNQATTTFANFGSDSLRGVGSKPCPACAYGLADMSGNVWELTQSFYLPYPFVKDAHPKLEDDALFVMRGGSYRDSDNNVRAAVRGGIDPGVRNEAIGFRLVLSQP